MQNHSNQIAPSVREITNLTPDQVIQTVDNGNGTITVTETRTITVKRDPAPTAAHHPEYDYHQTGELPPPPPMWPLWVVIGACVIGLLAALADIVKEVAIVAQNNPAGFAIVVGLLVAAGATAWSAIRGGR